MRRLFALYLFIPIYFLAMFSLYVVQILILENQSLEEFRLKTAVNYSVDAAVGEMLGSSDLYMDYADWGRVRVDPVIAVDAYSSAFCLNYEIPTTKENRDMVQCNYTKVFVVCAYDGYYVFENRGQDGSTQDYISTPKLIYRYIDDENQTYALNLGLDRCWRWSKTDKLSYIDCPLSNEECIAEINKRVSDDLNYRLDQYYDQGLTSTLYIPNEITTINRTNPIDRPTVMAFVDDVDLLSARKISAFGVGGANITQARAVAAYTRDGVKRYAYADLLPQDIFTATNPEGSKTFIEEMFMTCEEAAQAGYYHDPLYMN